jgi:D-alanyl-D-alanine carboxypeptidase
VSWFPPVLPEGPPDRSGEDPAREQRLAERNRDSQGAPWRTVLVTFSGFLAVIVGSFAAVGLLRNLGHGVAGWGPPALTLFVVAGGHLGLRMLRRRRRAWRQPTKVRRRSPILLVGAVVAVLALLAGTAVLWSRDRGRGPAASVSASRATRPAADPATLQLLVDQVVQAGPPGAVALVRTGQGTWQGASGLGDLQARRPASPADRFRIGSVTKSFVATVVLQLVGEGRLGLDDSVQQWLAGAVPGGERITIRQLLNHTSGLYDYTDDLPPPWAKATLEHYQRLQTRSYTPQALVAMATRHQPLFPPGTRFAYSSTNYILLGLVVERATGHRLAAQLQQRILRPLGLADTELPDTQRRIRGPHLHGYAPLDRAWRPSDGPAGLVDLTQANPSWPWAAGAMISSAPDLARFYQALLGGRLLGPELLKAMLTTVDASESFGPGAGYGLGLMRLPLGCGGQVWGHGGEIPGYATLAFSTKDAARQLVLTHNLLPAPGDAARSAVDNVISQALSCSPPTTPKIRRS